SDLPLAILPGGTANAVALALGVPLDPAAACALLVDAPSTIKSVDLGEINDQHFLIAIGVGIPGALAEAADRDRKDRLGALAYALGSLQALRSAAPAQYELEIDGERITRQAVMAVIANSGNFGLPGLPLAPDIDMNDGKLDVFVFENSDLTTLISTAASVVLQSEQSPAYERWQAHEVSIRTTPEQAIQADGEVLQPGNLIARLQHGAVKVLVPGGGGLSESG
ncbi:MAG TPA: diacylglycerol kinase family protein, partial [Anaerolineae bacterium]